MTILKENTELYKIQTNEYLSYFSAMVSLPLPTWVYARDAQMCF